MEFRTQYDKRPRYYCESGSPERPVLAGEYNKERQLVVVEKGKENLYEYINSFADSVNINVLLARFANGDKEALLQRAGAYIDISALPTNINDFIKLSRDAENLFNTLPVEVKKEFNNNVVEFISTIGDPSWNEKMNKSPAEIQEKIVKESAERKQKHKEASKVQFNSQVFGDDYEPGDDSPKVNPLTGNEVNE